jgi:membrane protein
MYGRIPLTIPAQLRCFPGVISFRSPIRFFTQDIWKVDADRLSTPKRWAMRYLKILLLSLRSFSDDRASVRAAALTLYSLLSIVPVLALLFGIAKGFGLEAKLEDWLLSHFPEQEALLQQAVVFARRMLNSTQGGVVAGAGVAFLIYSVVMVIGNIEKTFNHIWSITKPRPLGRKLSDYLSLILVGPFMVVGASSLNVYLATILGRVSEAAPLTNLIGPITHLVLRGLPLLLLWFLFTFIYVFLPNTKVRLASGLFGGAVTAVSYQLVQNLYIGLQIGVSKANAIYGSFAALPLFLLWMQTSWHIVLFGAELTHQHQDFEKSDKKQAPPDLSFRAIKRLSLTVCARITRLFLQGQPPPDAGRLGEDLDIPSRTLAEILRRLTLAGLVSEIATPDPDVYAYQPSRDPHQLKPVEILEALEGQGEDLETDGEEWKRIEALLATFENALRAHEGNRPLGAWMDPPMSDGTEGPPPVRTARKRPS